MKLLIDNFDGRGAQDYTPNLAPGATIVRKLNAPAALEMSLVPGVAAFNVPTSGARITLSRDDGSNMFTGYLIAPPTSTYFGWHDDGPQYRYDLAALSDVMLLNQKAPPPHPPFVARSAGDAFRQLVLEAMPGRFDLS